EGGNGAAHRAPSGHERRGGARDHRPQRVERDFGRAAERGCGGGDEGVGFVKKFSVFVFYSKGPATPVLFYTPAPLCLHSPLWEGWGIVSAAPNTIWAGSPA